MCFSGCVRRCRDCVPLRGSSFRSKLYFCSPRSRFNTTFEDKLQTSIFKLILYAPNGKVVSAILELDRFICSKDLQTSSFLITVRLRVKILHVAVVTSLTWPMSYWYFNGIISLYSLTCAITGAAGTTAGLVALSYFFRRVVGELSFDEDTQQVTISSLTFWGNRRNRTFPLTSMVPLRDSGINFKNTFHRLEVNGCSDVYLLNLRHCKIFHEKFFSVTGVPVDEIDLRETGLASRNVLMPCINIYHCYYGKFPSTETIFNAVWVVIHVKYGLPVPEWTSQK